jgi:hypothetical protein
MPIECAISIGMFDDDGGSITAADSGKYNSPSAGSPYRSSDRDGDIDPAVKDQLTAAERVYPPAYSGSHDTVLHRQVTIRTSCYR